MENVTENDLTVQVSHPDEVSTSLKFSGNDQYEEARMFLTYNSTEQRDESVNDAVKMFTKTIITGSELKALNRWTSYSYDEGRLLNRSVIAHTRNEKDNRSYIKIGHLEISRYNNWGVHFEWNRTKNPPLFAYGTKGSDKEPRTVVYSFKKKAGTR